MDQSDLDAGGCTLLTVQEHPHTPQPNQYRPLLEKGLPQMQRGQQAEGGDSAPLLP